MPDRDRTTADRASASPQLLLEALAQVDDAIIMVDGQLCVAYLNAKATAQYEVDADEALGRPLTDLYQYRWLQQGDEQAAMQLLAAHGRWRGENLHVLPSGKTLHVESTVTLLRDGSGGQYMLAVIRDMSAQKQAEAVLREAEQWQQLAIEGAQLGTWVIDLETGATLWDARCRQIFGVGLDEPANREKGFAIIHPEDRPRAMAAFAAAAEPESQGIYEVEKRIVWPDGSSHWIATRGRLMFYEVSGERKAKRLTGVVIDIDERKRYEERLLRANQRAAFAEAAAHGFIYEWNMVTGEVVRSAGLYRMLGFHPEELAGNAEAWRELIHPDDYPHVGNAQWAMSETINQFSAEYRLRHRNGHYLHVWDQGVLDRDADGKPIRLIGITTDISERKRIEQALYETQERFRLALEKAPLSFAHMDKELRYTWIYNPHPDFRGSAVIGRRDDELARNPGITRLQQTKQQVLDSGEGTRAEFGIPLSDGEHTYDISFEPLRDPDGQIVGLTTAALDITERKTAEEKVRRSEERLRRMLENAQVGICFTRTSGEMLECNDALLRMAGLTRGQFERQGVSWRSWIMPQDEEQVKHLVQQLERTGYLAPIERELRRQDGSALAAMVSASKLQAAGSAAAEDEYVFFIVDLTELKQARAALQELNDTLELRVAARTAELEHSNRELDRFAYIASHDLKSPLRAIDHLTNWIAEDSAGTLSPAAQEHLAKLRSRVKRLESLLDDLLIYSRAGRIHHAAEWVDTAALVEDIVEMLNQPPGMQVLIEGDFPNLRCERPPLETVLRNLIENAIKHHHQPHRGVIVVSAQRTGEFVEFSVRDNGPGIAPQYHERIFEVFQTLLPRDAVEGSGMGLAIVKKTVESAGGVIRLESEPHRGATFRVSWPQGLPDSYPG